MDSIKIQRTDCIEKCDGLILDAFNQNKPKDDSKIENLLEEYENYKFPNKSSVRFPYSINGKLPLRKNRILLITFRLQVQKQIVLREYIFWELHF